MEAGAIFSFMEAIACFIGAAINVSVVNCILTGLYDANFHYVTVVETINKPSLYISSYSFFHLTSYA